MNNRQIKFRAWDKKFSKMYFDGISVHACGEFDVERSGNGSVIDVIEIAESKHGELVLMQFTNLLDKNGVEIYEGDICYCVYPGSGGARYKNFVKWAVDEAAWVLAGSPLSIWEELEVIGNIYQHPHLLTK